MPLDLEIIITSLFAIGVIGLIAIAHSE